MTNAKFTLDDGVSTNACRDQYEALSCSAHNLDQNRDHNRTHQIEQQTKNSTQSSVATTTKLHKPRRLKVRQSFYHPPRRHQYIPYEPTRKLGTRSQLLLQGVWLNAAGFTVGSYVRVEVKQGQLIITAEES